MYGERERERERETERQRSILNLRSFSVLQGSTEDKFGHGPCTTHPGGRGRPPYPKGTNGRAEMGRILPEKEIRTTDTGGDLQRMKVRHIENNTSAVDCSLCSLSTIFLIVNTLSF